MRVDGAAATTSTVTKTSLETEVNLLCFKLITFIPSRSIRQCWQILLELNSKGLYRRSGEYKENRCVVILFSTKREIRHFHVVIVQ